MQVLVGPVNQQYRSNNPAEEKLGYPAVVDSDCHYVPARFDRIRDIHFKRLSPGLSFQRGNFATVNVNRHRLAIDLGKEQRKSALPTVMVLRRGRT